MGSTTLHRRVLLPIAIGGIAALTLAACSGGGGPAGDGPGDRGEADGVVTIYGTIADTEAELLEQSWADWETENDIDIQYESSKQFEAEIGSRAQAGDTPDLAIFPQPGLLGDLADRGYVQPAPEGVADNVAEGWSEDWAGYATVNDTLYGAPLMASVKGFVWYSPSQFEENGWEVPQTWDEMLALSQTIADTGEKPWCAGFGSDAATGWPGTDWVEDLVLREAGPDVYDQWVENEVPFTDPAIKTAFESVGEILLNPDYVNAGYGDVTTINSTPFGDPATALVDGDCALHHQASFYDGFISDAGGEVAEDGDIWAFLTPGTEAGASAVTGGGEIVAAFSNDEDTIAVQEYLSSADWANSRVSLGGVISANKGLDPANASSGILTQAIEILQDENTTFRFDASDLMPGAVGSGTFFKGMVAWVNGDDLDTVLEQIEAGWPSE
ncbi:ABC transporter substrate-binding protein [Homoserinibacter sp. YIM 151385]|uniref:ABC transporter substrate-binding protein n=1 Tax=Homoserinibacter sp. YIM 151385 TaxID=2985506 RepID=UPI0022F04696|nr:ABC transporter substrate-binding protein [Homoserinibacter sp. YIM 151385]WBU36927.1 ABC transporter substrate-binding protein [Homoserinibacter sp. YIM 151385]